MGNSLFRVLRVQGSGFKVLGSGFKVLGSGFWVLGSRFDINFITRPKKRQIQISLE